MGSFMGLAASTGDKLDPKQCALLGMAAKGFGPKLFEACVPEHAAMVDGIHNCCQLITGAGYSRQC
jgi:hypothetical protein